MLCVDGDVASELEGKQRDCEKEAQMARAGCVVMGVDARRTS